MPQTPATIKLSDLSLVIQFAKLRAANGGRTCQLAEPRHVLNGGVAA